MGNPEWLLTERLPRGAVPATSTLRKGGKAEMGPVWGSGRDSHWGPWARGPVGEAPAPGQWQPRGTDTSGRLVIETLLEKHYFPIPHTPAAFQRQSVLAVIAPARTCCRLSLHRKSLSPSLQWGFQKGWDGRMVTNGGLWVSVTAHHGFNYLARFARV